jgi:hypothetical protein
MVFTCHETRGKRNDTIDLRNVEIMRLSSEYIHALLPKFEMKEDLFWEDISDGSIENANTTIEEIFKDL